MKVLLGTSLALVLLAAAPSFAGPADTVGNQGGEGMYDEGAAPAPQASGQNAQGERPSRAERRAMREQRRAERGQRGANGDRPSREERRAQRAERRAQHADRGDRGDRADRRANRGNKRQFAMGDRVPRKMLAGRRVVTDYARYGVQAPHGGDQWVRGRKQLLLVSADGVVKNVIVRQKRRHRDRGEAPMPDQSDQSDQTVH
jgi:Ni/Co efflux regulator RcnB